MDQILAHTDGAPLFIEELTKMVLEGGLLRERDGKYVLEGPLPPLAIPTTLQASTLRRTGVISTRTESRRLIHGHAGFLEQHISISSKRKSREQLFDLSVAKEAQA
jgi:hypothetical protein